MAGAFRVIVAPDTHLQAPGVMTRRRLREGRMTTRTSSVSGHSPPSYAPENPLHLCDRGPDPLWQGHPPRHRLHLPSILPVPTQRSRQAT